MRPTLAFAVAAVLAVIAGARADDGLPKRFASETNDAILALAEAGDAEAQVALGQLLEDGRGGAPDYALAAAWYRRAADSGNPLAQYQLGQLYEHGRGVPQDYAEAARLYRAAAEGGSDVAGFQLGSLYEKGLGVPRDVTQALAWYDRAAAGWRAQSSYPLVPDHMLVGLPPPAAPPQPSAEPPPEPVIFVAPRAAAAYAHLASFRSPAEASAAWSRLKSYNPDLLASLDPSLAELDLGEGSGVFYQLLAGPFAQGAAATALCEALHNRKQFCSPVASPAAP